MEPWSEFQSIDEDLPQLADTRFQEIVESGRTPRFSSLIAKLLERLAEEGTLGEIEDIMSEAAKLDFLKLEPHAELLKSVVNKAEQVDLEWIESFFTDIQYLTENNAFELLKEPIKRSIGETLLGEGEELFYQLRELYSPPFKPISALEAVNLNELATNKYSISLAREVEHLSLHVPGGIKEHLLTRMRYALISASSEDVESLVDSPQIVRNAIRRVVDSPGILRNFLILTFDKIEDIKAVKDVSPLLKDLFDEVAYQAALEHSRTRGLTSDQNTLKFVNTTARPDEPPSRWEGTRSEIRNGCLSLRYRLAQYTLGFSGYQYSSKGIPTFFGENPLLARAAKTLGASVHRANASSHTLRPGPGVKFKGVDPYAFLDKDDLEAPVAIRSNFAQSVLDLYGDVLPHLKDTTFTFLRSAIVVQNPSIVLETTFGNKRFSIPCALVIFNEHFRGGPHDGCLLVPANVLPFKDSHFIEEQDYGGFTSHLDDICETDLSFKSLCGGEIPAANLLSISTIDGSFAKAFPPFSSPFMEWQIDLYAGAPDAGGHVHYYYAFSRWNQNENREIDLQDLARLHEAVRLSADKALRLLELFEVGFSHYCQGMLVGSKQDSLPAESFDSWRDSANQVMLKEAFLWFQQTRTDYPVLVMSPTFSPGVVSPESFYLDTKTMILQTLSGVFDLSELDGDEPSDRVQEIWTKEVVGPYFGGNLTPRFFHRSILEGRR